MFMPYYGLDPTFIVLIPALLLAFYAQFKVNTTYARFSRVRNSRNITGAQAARRILDSNGLNDVRIELIPGTLTDHYDPRNRVMRLSAGVYHDTSVAAVSIAAHESGHAVQHQRHYAPLIIRNSIVPVVNLGSMLAWPLLIIGLIIANNGSAMGYMIMDLGILFFAGVVLFHAITLPVELNASRRAMEQLDELGILYGEEAKGGRKVLTAAALTYVAGLATAVANLLRLLMLRGRD